ncbi:MAG: hypothetical protein ACM3US_01255 [Sphingomonadaceae bacterium]
MKTEPAVVMVIILGSVGFFFLLLPLGVVLAKLKAVWQSDRRTGVVVSGVVLLTGFFFTLFIVGLVILLGTGASTE